MTKKQLVLIFGLGGFMACVVGVFGYLSWQNDKAQHPVGQAAIESNFKVTKIGVDHAYETCLREGLIIKEDVAHNAFYIAPAIFQAFTLDQKRDMAFLLFCEASFMIDKCPDVVTFYDGYSGKKLAGYDLHSGFSFTP
jgi:hypothetical protein